MAAGTFVPAAKRTATRRLSVTEPPGGMGGTIASNWAGESQRPSSNSACTSEGKRASPTMRTRALASPTLTVSPMCT